MTIRVCIAGVTGWTGSAVAGAVIVSEDFQLAAGIASIQGPMPLRRLASQGAPVVMRDPGFTSLQSWS